MSRNVKLMPFLLLSCVWLAFADDRNAAVAGVWRGEMDGLPAIVMTVSDEGDELTGAVLFYLIRRDEGQPARSSPGTPEPMFHLKFDGRVLNFQVSHRRAHGARTENDRPVSFRLKITGPNEGILVREQDESNAFRISRDK
jgi:hypothetical protein